MFRKKIRKSGGYEPFKPPRLSNEKSGMDMKQEISSPGKSKGITYTFTQEDLEKLKNKEKELDEQIKELKSLGYKHEDLQEYIQLLHDYNDVKDAAQIFMGHIAIYECVTNREIAERYDAPKSD